MSTITSNRVLPSGWSHRNLGDLVTLSNESGIPNANQAMPFVGMEHIEAQSGHLLAYGNPSDYKSSSNIVDSNQILYGRLRPYLNKVFIPKERCFASREFIPMLMNGEVQQLFLLHLLRSSDFVEFAVSLNAGDRPRVKWPQMAQFPIALPPLEEQAKIVEILEEQLSRLDAALASVRAVREKSARFRRSLLHAAFTGALTGHDTSDGTLPDGWVQKQLGEIADVGWGDLQVTKSSYVANGYLAYSATGADGFLDYFDFDEDGIVLSAIGAGCGRTWYAKGRWSCIKNTMRILEKSKEVNLGFLFQHLSDPEAWPKRGSGQPFISQKDARELEVIIPPLAEQEKIVRILEEQLSLLDASLAVADAIEKKASALRRSLLHAAFNGNLTKEWREGAHV